tara:strand:- start:161 stop:1222 length:1062 start_codon:yes stop_codon:yes gene_type:complete
VPNDTTFSEIPIVDISGLAAPGEHRSALSEKVRAALHEVGFLIVTGHGVEDELVDAVFGAAREFFDLPVEQKRLIDKRNSRHFRGWEPEGTEFTNNQPDIREQMDLWSEHAPLAADVSPVYLRLLGPNQWPPSILLPGFETTLNRWFSELGILADQLMALLALGLRLPQDHFEHIFGSQRVSFTKLIRYPATPPGNFGVNAHHDAGFLTILAPGITPGLEVENAQGEWIPVPLIPGSFVINIGEMLQSITGNYYVATPHRVATQQERFSVGYFHGPSLDTKLTPITLDPMFAKSVAESPRHAGAGFMTQSAETQAGVAAMSSPHHPDVYGQQVWNYLRRSYPENMKRHYPDPL